MESTRPCTVVLGGTGHVGSMIVESLLADTRVVVPARTEDASRRLVATLSIQGHDLPDERLLLTHGSPDDGIAVVTATERSMSRRGWHPRHVIASIGGWVRDGPLVATGRQQTLEFLEDHLLAHLGAVATWCPVLRGDDCAYVIVTGRAAEDPMIGSGLVNLNDAALRMALNVLRVERQPPQVRFHELCLLDPVIGDSRNQDNGDPWITGEQIAEAVRRILSDARCPSVVRVRGRVTSPPNEGG